MSEDDDYSYSSSSFLTPEHGSGGVSWYQYFIQSRKGSLCGNETYTPNKNIAICYDLQVRRKAFAMFDTYLHFHTWSYHQLPPEGRRSYEIIPGSALQKPYFDIDLSVDSAFGISIEQIEKSVCMLGQKALGLLTTTDMMMMKKKKPRILVFSSNSAEKFSYHIVIDGVYLANNTENRFMCETTLAEAAVEPEDVINRAVLDAVDTSVYKGLQQLRILGCQKIGSGRVKIFRPELSSAAIIDFDDDLRLLSSSLVTEVSTCHPVNIGCKLSKVRIEETRISTIVKSTNTHHRLNNNNSDDDDSSSSSFLSSCEAAVLLERFIEKLTKEYKTTAPFKLRDEFGPFVRDIETGGFLVSLTRTHPSFCPICGRVHENDNPYMLVWSDSAAFVCRRSDSSGKIRIDRTSSSDNNNNDSKNNRLTEYVLKVFETKSSTSSTYSTVESTIKSSSCSPTTIRSSLLFSKPVNKKKKTTTKTAFTSMPRGVVFA